MMVYTKVNDPWEDAPSTDTPITAEALDHIEQGIADAHDGSNVAFDDSGTTILTGASTVQGALLTTDAALGSAIGHITATPDAHDASAISVVAAGFSGNLDVTDTDVQTALATIDALSLGGGSSAGILRYVTGTGDPSSGLGANDDWAVNDRSILYRKSGGTWAKRGRLSNYAQALVTQGWILGSYGAYVQVPNTSTAAWTKTNLAAQSNKNVNFSGSTANASAKLALPTEARHLDTAFCRVGLTTLPVGGPMSFGLGVTPFSAPWPLITVSTAGVVTVNTGSGGLMKTLSGTAAAGDGFTIQLQPGAVLIGWLSSAFAVKDTFLFASDFVNRDNLGNYGIGIEVIGTGTLTAGEVNLTGTEIML